MRTIAINVAAKAFQSNSEIKQSYRVIGTTDINGNGTEHAIAEIDPFIFLDETNMRGDEAWPFPKHPHCGLVAMTYMLAGEVTPWDNQNGRAKFNNHAGGLYYINSGKGIVHEEEPIVAGGPLRWLQLWMNPGIYTDKFPQASTQLAKAAEIPEHQTQQAVVRIIIGEAFQKKSPIKPDWPMQYLHVLLQPCQEITLPLQKADWQGFIYILGGKCTFGENQLTAKVRDCLVLGKEHSDQVHAMNNSDDEILEFVLLCGKPHDKPFFKILGSGGALIADTEDVARAAMHRFEANPEAFGRE